MLISLVQLSTYLLLKISIHPTALIYAPQDETAVNFSSNTGFRCVLISKTKSD